MDKSLERRYPSGHELATELAHFAEDRAGHHGAVVPPMYQNSLFVFEDWDAIDEAFDAEDPNTVVNLLRVRKDVGGASTVGGVYTDRTAGAGDYIVSGGWMPGGQSKLTEPSGLVLMLQPLA